MATREQVSVFVGNLFDKMDKESKGVLDKEEIHTIMKQFQSNHSQQGKEFNDELFSGVFAKIDNTQSGKVTRERMIEASINFAKN